VGQVSGVHMSDGGGNYPVTRAGDSVEEN